MTISLVFQRQKHKSSRLRTLSHIQKVAMAWGARRARAGRRALRRSEAVAGWPALGSELHNIMVPPLIPLGP